MEAPASDLTGLARIRNAALEGFARDGVPATSIRDVAKRAGVSPGLVQHYFPSKTALVDAVNAHVLELATDAFTDLSESTTPIEAQQELGDRVTAFVAEHPTALLYVARSTADRDDAALGIFDAFVAIAGAQWQRLADNDLRAARGGDDPRHHPAQGRHRAPPAGALLHAGAARSLERREQRAVPGRHLPGRDPTGRCVSAGQPICVNAGGHERRARRRPD